MVAQDRNLPYGIDAGTLLPNIRAPPEVDVRMKTYFVVFEIQRVLAFIQNCGESDISGLVHTPQDCCFDEVSVTLVGKSDLVRVRTNFVEFWEKLSALENVFPVIWSELRYDRVRDICSFLFQECSRKPGRIFSHYDMVEMRDRSGYKHRKPVAPGSIQRHGDVYHLKDVKEVLWSRTHNWQFNPMPPSGVHPDLTNTLLIDPNQETNISSPGNVLFPLPWHNILDRHSSLVRYLFPFIDELAHSGENVREFVKKNRFKVPGLDPVGSKSHVAVALKKWRLCR